MDRVFLGVLTLLVRSGLGLLALLAAASLTPGDEPDVSLPADELYAVRYGVPRDAQRYPQDSPVATIESIVQAARLGESSYLLAHLVDPREVDAETQGKPAGLLQLAGRLSQARRDTLIASMLEVLRHGRMRATPRVAVVETPNHPPLRLRRIGSRWYLVNRIARGR